VPALKQVVGIITGVVVLVVPFVATWVLAIFLWVSIAVWAALVGGLELATAWRLHKEIHGEIWLMLSGLLCIVLSGIVVWFLFTRPAETFLVMGGVMGAYATFLGVFLILLGIRLRRNQTECKAEDADAISGGANA
jgi:uncharacterized membrane protein HdeD (DUF308 family)